MPTLLTSLCTVLQGAVVDGKCYNLPPGKNRPEFVDGDKVIVVGRAGQW